MPGRELHIKPVEDLMKQFGMSDEDMDNMEDRMENMMQELGDGSGNPFSMMMNMGQPQSGEDGDEDLMRSISRRTCWTVALVLAMLTVGELCARLPAGHSSSHARQTTPRILVLLKLRIDFKFRLGLRSFVPRAQGREVPTGRKFG